MNWIAYPLIYLLLISPVIGCTTIDLLTKRVDTLEQQQARQYYLLKCDLCSFYGNPGTSEHESCIVNETRKWLEIKRRRGWN